MNGCEDAGPNVWHDDCTGLEMVPAILIVRGQPVSYACDVFVSETSKDPSQI